MNQIYATREQWLEAAINELSGNFLALGHQLPAKIRPACAFGSGGTRKRKGGKQVGECWHSDRSGDHSYEIMISPTEADPVRVLSILTHELCHAADGLVSGHKGPFAVMARGLHLEGPLTATTGGAAFAAMVTPIITTLGAYPHAALDTSQKPTQSTRMVKCQCKVCGYTVRTASKWLAVGTPACPNRKYKDPATGEEGLCPNKSIPMEVS